MAILKRALEVVKVKGRVLYSTTSLNPVENEAVVMAMIKEAKGKYNFRSLVLYCVLKCIKSLR